MHLPVKFLALSLLIYLSAVAHGANPSFPKLRDIATSFETNVELTDQFQDTTALAKEYYDFKEQTGRLDVQAVGQKISYYTYGKTDQVFTVDDSSCVENDGTVFEIDLFYNWTNADPMYVGPLALLLKVEQKKAGTPVYVDKTKIRSINCDHFRTKVLTKDFSQTTDYYFSDPEWKMPFKGSKTFPVRIVVNHIGNDTEVNQMIDFLYFRPNFNDKTKFQIPVGLGCYGKEIREGDVTLPKVPNQFSFGVEGFDLLHEETHPDTDVPLYRVWYDSRLKIGRQDKYTEAGLTSDLSDFKTGVQYHMHDYRTCKFRTLRKSIFLTSDTDTLVGRMKKPDEFLRVDGDFYTLGEADIRSMKCRVYEKAEKNVSFINENYRLLVTTIYFTTETKIQVDGEDLDVAPPVEVRITGYTDNNKVTLKRQYQIFAFDDEPGREFFSTFPIETCFPGKKQKSYFVIQVAATPEIAAKIEEGSPEFYEMAKAKIINTANITELRLPFMKVDFRTSGISITGLMLDKPPSLVQFWKLFEDAVMVEDTSAYVSATDAADEESCATACLELNSDPCKGFHFCGKGCLLNTGEVIDKPVDNIPIGEKCFIYIRAVSDSENDKASLEKALQNLIDAKDKGKLSFVAIVGKDEDLLPALEVITSFGGQGESVSDYPYTLVKDGYQLKGDVETTVEIPDADSEQECYRQCKEATTISCSSFSYCPKASNKICRISSVLLGGPKEKDEIDANAYCALYSMLYLDYFEPYTGKVILVSGDKTLPSVDSTEECAKNCREENAFRCRGFEYCKSLSSCVLHSKHVVDLKPGEYINVAKSECVHYAAKFSADYRDLGYLLIDDESNVRNEITLEECARSCSEEVSNCNSFNYCPPSSVGTTDSTCSLTSKTLYDNVGTKTKGKCHLYSKRENVEDWKLRRSSSKGGYTSGGFAGLLIGMIILGLVVGALLFVAYSYYRSRRGGDGLTVKFTKQENM